MKAETKTSPQAMGPADPRRVEQLQTKHGLTYHVPYAFEAESSVGLRGKRVLEVGGSLPPAFVLDDLDVAQWVAIEEMEYWEGLPEGPAGTRPKTTPCRRLGEVHGSALPARYEILNGGVEDLPHALEGKFDIVFSIAAFEHLLRMPVALDRMFAALRPGGRLFTMFSPIWSSHNGHHLPRLVDKAGKTFGFGQSPIPPWGHLLMRPAQLMKYLSECTDAATAAQMVHFVFHAQHINRLFTEDFAEFFVASRFHVDTLIPTFTVEMPPEIQANLMRLFPGRTHFSNNGLMAVLSKPDGGS